jgi:predicted nucleic acid-binding protein
MDIGSGVFLADTSAWHRSTAPAIRDGWLAALARDAIATCSIVRLELLYSARDASELEQLAGALAALRDVPVTVSVQRAGEVAMRELGRSGPGQHRVPLGDVLIAAAAQEAGLGVLHYDHHYDRLAEVLSFESRWIDRAGTL